MLSKNLNLVKVKVGEAAVNNKEVLELEAGEWETLNCIVQKNLLSLKFEKDNQRNKIFYIHSISNDKVCNVIIDNDISENIMKNH